MIRFLFRPANVRRALASVVLSVCALGVGAVELSDEQAGLTDYATTPEACHQALDTSRSQHYGDSYQIPSTVSLLSWNIYKAQRDHLMRDLRALSTEADILLLQEALLDKRLEDLKPYWRFAPGYSTDDLQTGVMTLSAWPASVHCRFEHTEPWLRTPKATSVVEYILDSGQRLLAVNMHSINFELGVTEYRRQLQDVVSIVAEHNGPAVLAGDLNSWSDDRRELLQRLLAPLGLTPAVFAEDNRTQAFGLALDHVWTRGVSISAAEVPIYQSSDHNPLLVSMQFDEVNDRVAQD